MPDVAAAEQFLAAHARVLDRRRYERLFQDGSAEAVRDAVAAYRNADGGFGEGLEPDGRCPGSQPPAIALALRTLHECDAWDDELARGACDWLEAHAPAEGGATFVDPSVEGWPHAPWWQPQDGLPASLVSTGPIASVLLHRGVEHPWLDGAVSWLREAAPTATSHYDLLGAIAFAEHEPGLAERLKPAIEAADTADNPLAFAAVLDDAEIARLHDELDAAQDEDGGWRFNWPVWSAAAEADWRGSLTVDALVTLRERT